MTDDRPKPKLNVIQIHAWPYGDKVWIEWIFEGDHCDLLQTIYGGPYCHDSVSAAAFRMGADLRAHGVETVFVDVKVHEHDEAKTRPHMDSNSSEGHRTDGVVEDEGIQIEFGGACPVQGYGVVDEHPVYYRARGTGWSLEFFAPGTDVHCEDPFPDPIYTFDEDPYAWPDGGWIRSSESISNIRSAVAAFRARNEGLIVNRGQRRCHRSDRQPAAPRRRQRRYA